MKPYLAIFVISISTFTSSLWAAIESHSFTSAAQEQTYHELVDELRCLVCQNQNLASSNSGLAKDLRQQTYNMVLEGRTKEQITQYMTQRYGDFVLYKPPFKKSTIILWAGPFLILLIAAIILLFSLKQSKKLLNAPRSADKEEIQ